VIYVSWEDAKQYVEWLSKATGRPYRLLSESEYEYAARAGTTTTYPWGDEIGKNNVVCYDCGSKWDNRETAPVATFAPNQFGLYDMVGNVNEWVEDCASSDYKGAPADGSAWIQSSCEFRMVRGGSWNNPSSYLRSAWRGANPADLYRYHSLGFRVARTLDTP
jgi:formylglycine-generating enzyme required for sulfatase activity